MKLAWSKNEDSNTINLIKYIDENAMYFKNKYNDLLESHNKYISLNTDLYNLLSFNKAHNLNNYSPRQYIIDNYGPINSGKKLARFLLNNFKNKLNNKNIKYVTIRNPLTNF